MKKSLIILVSLIALVNFNAYAQPANNNCATAQNLGSLPTPGACLAGLQNGTAVTIAGTTIAATATSPALSILNCQGGTADQFAPSPDVWYSFVATGTTVNVNITPGAAPLLSTPNIGLWTGACASLTAWGCGIGNAAGNLTASFTQIVAGQTYYIQVGGNTVGGTGNFNISVDNDIDCNNCNTSASLTASPLPTFGAYAPGTVVHFCYTVSSYSEINTNWFHGVQISMGAGWTGVISAPVPANDCNVDVTPGPGDAGDGIWSYYPAGITATLGTASTADDVPWPAGFYFDNINVAGTNAGNNFGDPGNCGWTFCWDLTVDPGCAAGSDLTVSVNTTGDGESGSWSSPGCTGDPAFVFNAQGSCCPPTMTSTPTCTGQTSGTATATPVGAGGPFTYSWTPGGQTTSTATGLAAGTYTVTVTNAALCAVTGTVTVTTNPLPVSNAGADIILCSGVAGSIGAASTAGYSYSWLPTGGLSSSTVSNPTVTLTNAGVVNTTTTYTVTTTITATGCTSTDQVIVTVKPIPTVTVPANISQCAGTIIAATAFTSTPAGATFAWTNSNPAIGLGAGAAGNVPAFTGTNATTAPITGTITVTPTLAGCPGTPSTYTITINPQPTSAFTQSANQCLTGNSFTFTSTPALPGGYTQTWNFGGGGAAPATSTVSPVIVTYTTPGTYTITHIVTAPGGCTSTTTSTVTIFAPPTAIIVTPVNPGCSLSNGSVTLGAVTGGTAGYTYSFNGSPFTATTSYPGLAAGTYTIIVKDANGCTFTTTVTLVSTSGPTALVVTTVNSTCGAANGVINIGAVTGGVAAFTYSVNASAFTGTLSYPGFAAGTYTVIVKDANGCTFTTTVTVVNTPGPIALATTTINSTCGASNGTVNIGAVTGGTAAYTYSFNGSPFTATLSYTGLASGTYTVIVKDANGCTFTTNATIINTPGPTALAVTTVNSHCGNSDGIINIGAVTGGTAAYTYSVAASAFTATVSYPGFAAGTYTIIVKDANGCTFTTTATIVNSPGPIAIVTTTGNSNCGASNGTITLGAVTGGIPAYTYSVNGSPFTGTTAYLGFAAGTYTVIVKDANGCTFTTSAIVNNSTGPTALAVTSTNATCGSSNGTVTIGAVTGGLAPYTYSFNGSAFTATTNYTLVAAGTYTVVVKDNNGCTFTTTIIVNNNPGPTALAVTTVNSTCGAANGVINIGAVTGGSPAYTYSVNASAFTGALSYTFAAGTYTVIVKDANGCTFTTTATIANTPGPTAVATTLTNTTCGNSNGSVVIGVVTGGTAGYTYSFNGSPFTGTTTYSLLAAGTYTIIVKDANGCTFTSTVTLTNTPGPTALAIATTNSTCGNSNGTITIGVTTGGSPGYSYSFNGGGFTATTSYIGLAAGTYPIIVKDANGCTFTVNPVVINTPGPTALATTTVSSTCGGANGSITIGAATGGTAPYSYSVNGSAFTTTTTYSGLSANTYTVIVHDANGCAFTTTAIVTDLSGLTASITAQTNVSCFGGNNGSVTVTATGSTAPYSYSFNGGAFGATGTFNLLTAGTYTITAKDGNGCTVIVTVTISQPPLLVGVLVSQTNVLCFGGNTGGATVSASGGVNPYTYSIDLGPFGASPVFTGLAAGTHTITIKDGNGCTVIVTVIITQPPLLAFTTSSTNAICTAANGSATVVATGGTPSYSYLWTPGAGATTATYGSITAGIYNVVVTDANGCIKNTTVSVGSSPGGTASISASNNVTCTGASNGNATVSMSAGATPPFTYSWSPSGGTAVTATGLSPASYTVTVTDGNGCIATATIVITQPAIITNSFINTNVTCNGGSNGTSAVNPAGGTPPYTYLWSAAAQTTQTAFGLTAGTYTCTITDANGCTLIVTTTITQPAPMALTETHVDANCGLSNGSATVSAGGGVGPYTYSWSTLPIQITATATGLASNTYVVTVTDANACSQNLSITVNNLAGPSISVFSTTNVSCNSLTDGNATVVVSGGVAPYGYVWSDAQTLPTATNLGAGTYTVTATDVNGCVVTTSVTITEPLLLITTFTSTNPVCFGSLNGTINTTTNGGTLPYSYLWSPGGAITPNLTGLAAGTYTLQVTDAHGCITVSNVTLTNPAAITASTTTTNVTCSGLCNGTATVSLSAGTGPITYLWTPTGQSTSTATALCAGTYSVLSTDANGCSATTTAVITSPASLTVNITSVGNVTCFGACDGFSSAAVTGGSAPFSFIWNPGGTAGASVNNLCAGTYTVTATDANGCSASTTQLITQPNPLIATITNTNVTCFGACDAQATAVYTGGTGPYTFIWTPSLLTTPTVAGLCAGIQNLSITDSHGCTATNSVVITEPTVLAVSTTTTNSDCGTANGTACSAITGGSPPFTYSWNDPATQTTNCATGLNAGVYTISITDGHGCSVTNVANVNDNTAPVVSIVSSTNVTCAGAANGSATGTIAGGAVPYSISWTTSPVQTNTFANNLSGGTYSMVVTDAAGCISSVPVTITEPTALISGITSSFNTSCNLSCDGSATVLTGGGTAPYTYLWNDVATQTTTTATNLCAQTYSVTTTDANGCTSVSIATISQPTPINISLFSSTNVSCNGGNNGQITISVSGGTPGYTYAWLPSVGSGPIITNLVAGSYQVTITDLHGCTQVMTFTITQPPPIVLSSTSNFSTCGSANGSAGVSVAGGTSPYSYLWTPTGTATAIVTSISAGTYSVVVTDFHGCTATITAVVADSAGPTITGFTSIQPSCFGLPNGSVTVLATGGAPLYTYAWTGPGSQTTQTASGFPAGIYTVVVTDARLCNVTGTVVLSQPSPLSIIGAPNDTICIGQLAQIYGAGSGGTGPYSYVWNPAGFGTTGGPFVVTPTSTSSYTVTMTDANGCISGSTITTVFVNPQINVTATDATVCEGSFVTISASASGGTGGPYTYSWSNGAIGSSQSVSPTIGSSPFNYIVSVSDGGCSISVTDTSTVIVNPLPIIFMTSPDTAGCASFLAQFTGLSNIGVTYSWNFGDGSTAQTGTNVSHLYPIPGSYNVTLTATTGLGCSTSVTNTSFIDVYPAPVAGFSASPNPVTESSPEVSFVDGSSGALTWQWNFIYPNVGTGLDISSLQNPPPFVFPSNGTYTVQQIVTNSFGCADTAYNDIVVVPEYVFYAPNAFTPLNHDGINDNFIVKGIGIDPDNFEMLIFDRWGNLIFKSTDLNKGWDGKANGGKYVAQIDVYVWKVNTKDFSGANHQYIGHVTIVK